MKGCVLSRSVVVKRGALLLFTMVVLALMWRVRLYDDAWWVDLGRIRFGVYWSPSYLEGEAYASLDSSAYVYSIITLQPEDAGRVIPWVRVGSTMLVGARPSNQNRWQVVRQPRR